MNCRTWLALLAAGLLAGAAVADDVHLTNGESFEGVIASREGDQVRIRLEFGELRLAAASVERIDSAESALGVYLKRRRGLLAGGANAPEWLELARWARSRGLEHGYRESLLEAATIDPSLPELEPGMRDLNYVYDAELDRWIPYAEHERRTRPATRSVESREARAPAEDHREVEETLSRTVELLALAQLERETRETRQASQTRSGPSVQYGFPVARFGGFFIPHAVGPVDTDPGEPEAAPAPTSFSDLARRPPGSLLPPRGNSGARVRQPGSLLPTRSGRR